MGNTVCAGVGVNVGLAVEPVVELGAGVGVCVVAPVDVMVGVGVNVFVGVAPVDVTTCVAVGIAVGVAVGVLVGVVSTIVPMPMPSQIPALAALLKFTWKVRLPCEVFKLAISIAILCCVCPGEKVSVPV